MAEKKKTHSKVKDQKWGSDERAGNLLANLLGETEAESAAEQRRLSAERKRKEALEREEQARSAERRQLEAQAHLEAERTRQADMEAQRAQMRAEIERRRRRESGEVEPQIAKPAGESRELDRAHEQERTAARGLIAEQQRAIRALTEEVAANNDDVEPRRGNLGWLLMAALILIVAAGATYAFMPTTDSPTGIGEAPQGAYPTMLVQLEPIDTNMTEVGLDLVAQAPNAVPTVIEAAPEVASKPKNTHHRTPKPTDEPALTVPDVFGRSPKIIP